MYSFKTTRRMGPIAVDVGQRSVKLLQLGSDGATVVEAGRWDLTVDASASAAERGAELTDAIVRLRQTRKFRGRQAVLCLAAPQLFVQNIRVAKASGEELDKLVRREAETRLPFPATEAELCYLDAADVRQGEVTRREVVLLACHQPVLRQLVDAVRAGGLDPAAVDIEPAALLRCYTRQYRRDDDKDARVLYLHVGATNSVILIARGNEALFVKYIDVGGHQLDDAVARHLEIELDSAAALRRHNGDRRADQQDPEVARTVQDATSAVIEKLADELSLCMRYYSVTFRGQPLSRLVLTGGEASQALADSVCGHLELRCELGDPLRSHQGVSLPGRRSQWDVAMGLALRELG